MTRTHLSVTEGLHRYLLDHVAVDAETVRLAEALAEETVRRFPDRAGMQIATDEGALLFLLVRISGARRLLEVGTFTGMSSPCIRRVAAPFWSDHPRVPAAWKPTRSTVVRGSGRRLAR